MDDPTRLLEGGATANERLLLQAGDAEEPPKEGPARLAAALGVASGALATASASGAKAASASSVGGAGALKWIAVAAGSAALGGALVLVTTRPKAPDSPAVAPRASAAPERRAPVTAPAREVPRSAETRAREGTGPGPREAPKYEPPSAVPPGPKSIAGEIAALDEARKALARGQPFAALSGLNEYDERFPEGTLKQEGVLLRIEALAKAGELPTARGLAASFLRDHPGSPHEKRIRALVGEGR